MAKIDKFAFLEGGKESFRERLKSLIGSRSVRVAAKDWGIPYSTLNNYLVRETIPALNIAHRICEAENVDLEWLATGKSTQATQATQVLSLETELQAIVAILTMLEPEERSQIAKLLGRKGAEVLALLLERGSMDLLNLSGDKREIALILKELSPKRAREILLEIKQCDLHEEKIEYPRQASA